jgi:ATP-binding cassette subfamily C (CFTR/MRP) protein 1
LNTTYDTAEKREFGLSDWKTWLVWFRYAGGILFVTTTFLSLFIDRGFYVINELWLATWTAAAYDKISRLGVMFPAQSEGPFAQYNFIAVYATILGISFIGTALRSQIIVQGGANCAEKLFLNVTNRVVYAPMSYFETTPIGRILNRLTYDIETLDISLSQSMTVLLTSLGWFVTGVVLQIAILPMIVCVLVPVIILYWMLLLYYRKAAVDLQRLDAVSRSPVQAKLAESEFLNQNILFSSLHKNYILILLPFFQLLTKAWMAALL